MENLIVTNNILYFRNKEFRCAIGRSGVAPKHSEGDGTTPLGTFSLRECWYRADKLDMPETQLPLRVINPNDGWCDDPASLEYNQHVTLPYQPSHEKLWRDDATYDIIVPIGYNDAPILPGQGSAIFFHIAKPDYGPTEGCVAVSMTDMLEILPHLSVASCITVRAE
ncbi:MAG: L,D-transpeptidase [Alphaproteobacteria bacterium]